MSGKFATLFCSGLHIIYTFLSTRDKVGAATSCTAWYTSAQSAPFWDIRVSKLGPHLVHSRLRQHIGSLVCWGTISANELSVLSSFPRLHTLSVTICLASVHRKIEESESTSIGPFPPSAREIELSFSEPEELPLPHQTRALQAVLDQFKLHKKQASGHKDRVVPRWKTGCQLAGCE